MSTCFQSSGFNKWTMHLGGDDGSSIILDVDAIQKLDDDTQIAGKWKIYNVKPTDLAPKKPNYYLLSMHLMDIDSCDDEQNHAIINKDKLLECRIWQHPKSEPIPQKYSFIIVQEAKAKIKRFNGLKQIHIHYKHVEYIYSNQLSNQQLEPSRLEKTDNDYYSSSRSGRGN